MKPSRWSVTTKLRLSQIMTIASVFAMTYCLGHMNPFAPPRDNIRWAVGGGTSLVVGIVSVLCLYYYRAKAKNDTNPDELALKTLAALAKRDRIDR
jgi:hypothetical protein